MKLTTKEMICALALYSTNESVKKKCMAAVTGEVTMERFKNPIYEYGSFLSAVSKGDYNTAMARADDSNKAAMLRYQHDIMVVVDVDDSVYDIYLQFETFRDQGGRNDPQFFMDWLEERYQYTQKQFYAPKQTS